MRKLASIQKIKAVHPIKEADKIELVHVLGWQCVATKDEFKEGDWAVYFEIDSFLPLREEFEFLRKSSYRNNDFMGEGFKLRTMKFRGEISQGLCLSPGKFPEITKLEEGLDVTELLGVRKWETPEVASNNGTIIGERPGFIPKTDEMRIQSSPETLEEFRGVPYYITTKLDGSSHSLDYRDQSFSYTGREIMFKDNGQSSFVEYCKNLGISEKIKQYVEENALQSLTLQGEWCGAGIQKNRLKLWQPTWFVFTVRVNDKRAGLAEMEKICQAVGCQMVPVEEKDNDLLAKYPDEETLLKRAEGIGYNNTMKEGIVIRPQEPTYSQTLREPLSLKVINNKYLLKNED